MANFAAYQSRGQLAAPEVHFTKPVGVSYDNPGERALARVNADTAGVIVKGYENWKEQYDSGKVMEANNEYNRLMSEGTAELMQKKQENALNIVQDYDKLHQKALDQVRKKFGAFINYGKPGQAFNIYTERDNNTRREHMMKYQMAETEAYHETQFNNQLAECQNLAAQGGYSDLSIEAGMNRANGFIEARYAQYGKEMIEQQKRVFQGEIVAGALQLAINMSDYKRVGEISNKYASLLDPKTRVTALSMLGKRQREATDLQVANNMIAKYGLNATWDDIYQDVERGAANGNGLQTFLREAQARLGVTMENGRDGCAEYVFEVLSKCSRFGRDNASIRWCGDALRAAERDGSGAQLLRYNGTSKAGDIFVYFLEGDDITNFDNAMHVTVSDGNGGYYGNSSSAKDYVDENGNEVRGDGCGVHADSPDIDGYQIAYIIRPDDLATQAMTDLEKEEETNRRWKIYQEKVGRIQTANNHIISQGNLKMADLRNHGVMDEAQYQAVVNEYSFQNGVVNDDIRIPLETTMRTTLSVLEKEAAREAKQASGTGGSGDGKKNSDPLFQSKLETLLRSGASREQCLKLIDEENPTGGKDLINFVDNYFAGEGKFAEKWGDYKDEVAAACDLPKNDPSFDFLYSQATNYAYELIMQYRDEHGGREPTAEQKKDYIIDGMTKNQVDTGERGWLGGAVYKESPLTRGQWYARGVYNDPAADYDSNRGLYYIQTRKGMFTATEEQYQRIVAGEDADVVLS